MIVLDIIVAGIAVAIFIGTLMLGKRQKSEGSATTRRDEMCSPDTTLVSKPKKKENHVRVDV